MKGSHPMATLLNTMDPADWATEFCRIFNGKEIGTSLTQEMMTDWFAKAIETGKRLGVQERSIVASSDDAGIITLPEGMPNEVLVSSTLLQQMIDKFNDIIRENAGRGLMDSFQEGATDAERQHPQ